MNTTTVTNIKSGQAYDVYIGRANTSYGLPQSKWHNPIRLASEVDRSLAIAKYRMWIMSQPRLLADIHELRGKVLACWCYPRACHGDVLAELANAPERVRRERIAAPWATEVAPGPWADVRAYWRAEMRLGCTVALERLQDICRASGWDYAATLEALR